jgi:amino acid transporter
MAETTERAPVQSAATGAAFVRKSSGLIKAGTPWRIFFMAFAVQGIGAFMALTFLYGVGPFPQTNILLAILIMIPFLQLFNVAYGLMAGAYPRSGGDYVFGSRIIAPIYGFVTNFGWFIAICFFASTGAYIVMALGLAPALQVFGVITKHPSFTSAGIWLAKTDNAWLVASVLVLGFGVLVACGMKIFYRYQAITWWIGGTLFLLLLIVYATSSHADFVNGFNHYMAVTAHEPHAYARLMAAAQHAGVPHTYSLHDTLGLFAVMTATTTSTTALIGGEVRTPLRTQMLGGVGGGVAYCVVMFLIGLIIASTTGLHFNLDATYLATQHPGLYTPSQSPVFTFYAFLCTSSPVLLFLMMGGIVVLGAYLVPSQILYPTRMLFAWSFDRLIPKQVANVSPRSNSPIIATVIGVIVCEVLLALYGSGVITFINPILIFGVTSLLGSIAAFVMPFAPRSREHYRNSAIKREILGLPLISVAAFFAIIFWVVALYVAFTYDALGANATSNIVVAAVVFAIPICYYPAASY